MKHYVIFTDEEIEELRRSVKPVIGKDCLGTKMFFVSEKLYKKLLNSESYTTPETFEEN